MGKAAQCRQKWLILQDHIETKILCVLDTNGGKMKKSKHSADKTNPAFNKYKIQEAFEHAKHAGDPTYFFNIGDEVSYGGWHKTVVKDVLFNGEVYRIACSSSKTVYGKEVITNSEQIVAWVNLRPCIQPGARTTQFKSDNNIRLSYSNVTVESLLHKHYFFGVNFEPDYQRGYVWDQTDKDSLLESIFMGAEIGRFVFKRIPDEEWIKNQSISYEIVDGKQRLLTLLSYYENRWPYKGVYFNQLSNNDRRCFLETYVAYSEIRDISKEDTLRLFIRLNRCGRPVSDDIIDHAKSMLAQKNKEGM